jgi:hypothetical protein
MKIIGEKMVKQRRENMQLWVSGIILGVFGNLLVSASVEIVNSSGFEQTLWTLVLAVSWIFFMGTLSESARRLNLPTHPITILTYAFLAFMVIWALIVFLVLPLFI